MEHTTCAKRWRRGVGFGPWADALWDARCSEREWVRALLRRILLEYGRLFPIGLLLLLPVFVARPRRMNIVPTGGSRRVATCPADGWR
jgi:hypothetical protein